jgi:formylglycine-generating enzyme required for sulfatase activity
MKKQLNAILMTCLLAAGPVATLEASVERWEIQVRVDVGGYHDHPNFFGVDPQASDQYDALDALEPPFAPAPSVALFVSHPDWAVHPGFYTRDIRRSLAPVGPATEAVWVFYVVTSGAALGNINARLTWAGLEGVPEDYDVTLTDVVTGAVRNLREADLYEYHTGAPNFQGQTMREFRLEVRVGTLRPRSRVQALPAYTGVSPIRLAWGPESAAPVITGYTIQVYDEGSAVAGWQDIPGLRNTTATSGTYAGQNGRTYRFRSVAAAGDVLETDFSDLGDTVTTVDLVAPVTAITQPADRAIVTGQVAVHGTATDTHLDHWTLAVARADGNWQPTGAFRELHRSASGVQAGLLHTWDSRSADGNHLLRLEAMDRAGHSTRATVRVNVQNTPPRIVSCRSENLIDPNHANAYYKPGTQVKITIREATARTGLHGAITIGRQDGQPLRQPILEAPMSAAGQSPGHYAFVWATAGEADGVYWVETSLADEAGNADRDGSNDHGPDLLITLDGVAPELRVSTENSLLPSDNDGVYSPGQRVRIRATDARRKPQLEVIVTVTRAGGAPLARPVSGAAMIPTGAPGVFEYVWDTTGEPSADDYQVQCVARDPAGNLGSAQALVQLKANAPAAAITSPAIGSYQRGRVDVRGLAGASYLLYYAPGALEDIEEADWVLEHYSPTAVPTQGLLLAGLNMAGWSDGPHTLRLSVSDVVQKVTSLAFVTFWIDTRAPGRPDFFLRVEGRPGRFVRQGDVLCVSGSAEPGARIVAVELKDQYGGPVAFASSSIKVQANGEITGCFREADLTGGGTVYAGLSCVDAAGNSSILGFSNELIVDNEGPRVTVDNVAHDAYFATLPYLLEGRYADAGSGVVRLEISLDGGTSYTPVAAAGAGGVWRHEFTASFPGLYRVRLRGEDALGNVTITEEVPINYVPGWPACNLTAPPPDSLEFGPVEVRGTAAGTGALTWQLAVAEGANPAGGWQNLGSGSQPVLNGLLASWTRPEAVGVTTLRLSVTAGGKTVTCYRVLRAETLTLQGTPIEWLREHGVSSGFAAAEWADLDNDLLPAWQEYLAGTDPRKADSVLRVESVAVGSAGFRLGFPTAVGRQYRVQFSDDLILWRVLAERIQGTGQRAWVSDETAWAGGGQRVYRVRGERLALPRILVEPADQTVAWGSRVEWTVSASGWSPLSYQWYRNGEAIPGATGLTLAMANVQPEAAGWYTVRVSNVAGTATSREARLQIAGPQNMVWIRPGTFRMGSPSTEEGRYFDFEGPQTDVTISRGFWMGKYEVTQGEYEAVRGTNPSQWKGANLPVERVSWNDAVAYCQQLTARERGAGRLPAGWEYRLPTEAQWEYACRAGTRTRFSFGDSNAALGQYAWYTANSGSRTRPVGGKLPNGWGLYDMHGTVSEWCLDWFSRNLPGGRVTDPVGPISGSERVFRGGCWNDGAELCRSACRRSNFPQHTHYAVGFRVALVQVP